MFENESFDGHEHVSFHFDGTTGLKAVIAIHSSALGPAMGGCRAWSYANETAALTDALRLSRGMSYKNAVAGLPLGGGKAVILRDSSSTLDDHFFESFGGVVEKLGGRYVTAEDVGVSERSMVAVARRTSYVSGLPLRASSGSVGGDPSPKTALGVFLGIRAAVRSRLDRSDLGGLVVAVQGLGNVGRHLCQLLHEAGAKLLVADLSAKSVDEMASRYGATAVAVDEILTQQVDVVAPCAMGGVLTEASIPALRTKIIAGAANNQLREGRDGQRLFDAGILYAPDYVINAGGIISAGLEFLGEKDASVVNFRIAGIEKTLAEIFARSRETRTPTDRIADGIARERLSAAHGSSAARM